MTEYRLSALPSLYDLFVRLVKYLVGTFPIAVFFPLFFILSFKNYRLLLLLVLPICNLDWIWSLSQLDNKQEDRDQIVILFQDMLEVVTRDIMMEDHISK